MSAADLPPVPVAIVTGAGSGIGRAIAQRFGREGWNLVLVGRNEERLRETDLLLAAGSPQPGGTEIVPADLTDSESAAAVVDAARHVFGKVDVVVNNAGTARAVAIDETNARLLEETFAVNVFAPAHLIAAVWPLFKAQHHGRLVNVSSIASFDPFPGFFVYAATKAALDSMTRSVAIDGVGHGITAFSVNPGAVETRLLRSLFTKEDLPPHRALDPRGVAEVVWECAAGLRDFDNGRAIPVLVR